MKGFRTNMLAMMILGIIFTIVFWVGVIYITYLAFDKYTASPQEIVESRIIK